MVETFLALLAVAGLVLGIIGVSNAGAAMRRQRLLEARIDALEKRQAEMSAGDRKAAHEGVEVALHEADPGGADVVASLSAESGPPLVVLHEEVERSRSVEQVDIGAPRPLVSDRVERALGLVWATRIGAGLLLLGVLFFFKVAVERNWLGPWSRVGLGLGVGVTCIALAAALRRRVGQRWVGAMVGVGMAIVLASVWVAHGLYGLVPQWVAFGALSIFAVMAGVLAVAWEVESVLVTASALGFINLAALSGVFPDHTTFMVYGTALSGALLFPAMRHRWDLAAMSVPLGLIPALVSRHFGPPDVLLGVFGGPLPVGGTGDIVGAIVLALVVAVMFVTVARRLWEQEVAVAFLCWSAVVLPLGMAGALVDDGFVLGAIGFGMSLAVAVWRRVFEAGAGQSVAALDTLWMATHMSVGLLLVVAVSGELHEPGLVDLVFVVGYILVSVSSAVMSRDSGSSRGRELAVVAAMVILWSLLHESWQRPGVAAIGAALVGASALVLAALWVLRSELAGAPEGAGDGDQRRAVIGSASISALVLVVLAVFRMRLDEPATTLILGGLGLLVAALARRAQQSFVWLSSVLLMMALLVFATVDVPAAERSRYEFLATGGASGAYFPAPWVGVAGLSMLALAVVGLMMRRVARRAGASPSFERHQAVIRVAGFGFLLGYLITQVLLVVQNGALAGVAGGARLDEWHIRDLVAETNELTTVLTTAVLAIFGALVLAWGFIVRARLDRWVGLVAVAAALGKLVTYDLTIMDSVARTVVLVSFGVLLLASGFLYARFAPGVKSLLGATAKPGEAGVGEAGGKGDPDDKSGGGEGNAPAS